MRLMAERAAQRVPLSVLADGSSLPNGFYPRSRAGSDQIVGLDLEVLVGRFLSTLPPLSLAVWKPPNRQANRRLCANECPSYRRLDRILDHC